MNNKNDKTNPIFGGSIGNGPYNYYQEQNFKKPLMSMHQPPMPQPFARQRPYQAISSP